MADGRYLAIADVQIGDYVQSVDPETGEASAEPVLDVIIGHGTKNLINIDDDADPSNGYLEATAEHPMWVLGQGWTNAENVPPGDSLVDSGGKGSRVFTVFNRGPVVDQTVFNLTVGNLHTFIVWIGSSSTVVHNSAEFQECKIPTRMRGGDGIFSPGRFARKGIMAPSSAQRFSKGMYRAITKLGQRYGCHRCGVKVSGRKTGFFTPDHWPANAVLKKMGLLGRRRQMLLPHCKVCSDLQMQAMSRHSRS
ncbi:polymorphic toxin-type HINT domain-containing protein [Streptomyces sp. NPDC048340]|uniref:polymorphic toxin-type HINT domain-containing protein n=1 Tax=Streptomyces sp. NPDC048340 TaxID=3365537 RepID=UPI0037208491